MTEVKRIWLAFVAGLEGVLDVVASVAKKPDEFQAKVLVDVEPSHLSEAPLLRIKVVRFVASEFVVDGGRVLFVELPR